MNNAASLLTLVLLVFLCTIFSHQTSALNPRVWVISLHTIQRCIQISVQLSRHLFIYLFIYIKDTMINVHRVTQQFLFPYVQITGIFIA